MGDEENKHVRRTLVPRYRWRGPPAKNTTSRCAFRHRRQGVSRRIRTLARSALTAIRREALRGKERFAPRSHPAGQGEAAQRISLSARRGILATEWRGAPKGKNLRKGPRPRHRRRRARNGTNAAHMASPRMARGRRGREQVLCAIVHRPFSPPLRGREKGGGAGVTASKARTGHAWPSLVCCPLKPPLLTERKGETSVVIGTDGCAGQDRWMLSGLKRTRTQAQ